jgi:uncharacterized protein YhbP (UPF0306 family)
MEKNKWQICLKEMSWLYVSLAHTLCSFEHYQYTCCPAHQGFSSSNFTFIVLTEHNCVNARLHMSSSEDIAGAILKRSHCYLFASLSIVPLFGMNDEALKFD